MSLRPSGADTQKSENIDIELTTAKSYPDYFHSAGETKAGFLP